jgi:plastocyanin
MLSRSTRALSALAALAVVLAFALVTSCSNNNSSTAPPPNPGTGPTFSFAFPAPAAGGAIGTSNKRVFNEVGSWGYHCIPHQSAGMVGTINVVKGAPAESALVQVGAGGLAFSPSTVTIDSGGYVRWVNVSGLTVHTATRP